MCGIAGLLSLSTQPSAPDLVAALDQALAHRGPDDAGVWSERGTTLVHRRLAIQDLSPAGHQPMPSACGRYVLVFNGEIYNQRELRRQLERLGHRFHSSSDTEVLLELYARYGLSALQRLRGMYAFCLWDRQERRALLARDPYGIKPLYLHHGNGGELLFASELRALLATGRVPRRLDGQGLADFLNQGSLPHHRTLVEGITPLPPGHLGLWQEGRWQLQRHWQPSYAPDGVLEGPDLVSHTRAALGASVRAHLLSDVPVGLFLSGGLDSSAVLALAEQPLTTVSIGFAEAGFDESGRAAALARQFGATHHSVQLRVADAAATIPGFLQAIDQPSVDGFNTYGVSKLAAGLGLKVVLSGLGGDELFGGYPSFQRLPRAWRLHRRLAPLAPLAAAALGRSHRGGAQRLADGLRQPASIENSYRSLRGIFSPSEVGRLLRHWGLEPPLTHGHEPPQPCGPESWVVKDPSRFPTAADQIAWLESSLYMGQQLLIDSDGMAMAHALELRLPLVDAELLRALAGQPAAQRLAAHKRLLRQAVPEAEALVGRAPKQGFAFPFQCWFDADGFHPSAWGLPPLPPTPADLDVRAWARRWGLLVLSDWLKRHLGVELA
ncbi:asparagine synthase (glutamine-hydrolyzing) [Cyanobium sp. Morenito 9A2]|uniref:asparagine synthase (glutamine-hydrolyzing) n=1 Tax=Cyanobium sp. Morenito 9A2 TaxID=2823718 RepID=UPI0020CCF699|nr:asparagine synthase (glutamine-hydrolyzing) [Cyanobium sp. Morenito 9A2]MCP9849794.1 asparagine synthase (glutamine-hydrolyzing) [Cyanobium sp. Morenito 9A2]